jgi:hypothetical protein
MGHAWRFRSSPGAKKTEITKKKRKKSSTLKTETLEEEAKKKRRRRRTDYDTQIGAFFYTYITTL